jgi:hypothetical protein
MRDEPGFAVLGVPLVAVISFLPGMFAGAGLTKINHINNQVDSAYQYDITAGEGETGYVGFERNSNRYAITFNEGAFNVFEPSTRHPNSVVYWERDPGDALDHIRSLRASIEDEIESLKTGAKNSDISIFAFEQLSPFHQNPQYDTYERNFDGMVPAADGMSYAQRLDAALVLLDQAEEYIVSSDYGQQNPDVPTQAGMREGIFYAAIFPALVLLGFYGSAPVGAGVSAVSQISSSRRRKKSLKP